MAILNNIETSTRNHHMSVIPDLKESHWITEFDISNNSPGAIEVWMQYQHTLINFQQNIEYL